MEAAPNLWPALGVLLMRDGLVSEDELFAILDEERDPRKKRISGHRLGELLVDRGVVTATQVARLVAEQYELPFMDLDVSGIDLRVAAVLSEDQARRYSAVPVTRRADGSHLLAIADPATVVFSDELRQILGSVPHFAVVGPEAIAEAIAFVHERPTGHLTVGEVRTADNSALTELHTEAATAADAGDVASFQARRAVAHLWPPLGALLIREGLLSDAELERALAQQRFSTSRRLGEILVERGIVAPAAIARLVAEQYELPFVELDQLEIDASIVRLLPEGVARKCNAVPIAKHENGALAVAIADPTNVFYSDDLHAELGGPVRLLVASVDSIEALIAIAHSGVPALELVDAVPEQEPEHEPTGQASRTAPALVVDSTTDRADDPRRAVEHALNAGASAIHISHQTDELRIRARIDGQLRTIGTFPDEDLRSLLAALEVDDALQLHSLPTKRGSKLTVLRLEQGSGPPRSLAELGLSTEAEETLRASLGRAGAVVVSGPAASGVTSTLYAALEELNRTDRVVATLEDRAARLIDGVDQVEIDETTGATFASALEALCTTDTDVILVGALPDRETADMAFRAALGGRTVLGGLTAPDAPTALLGLLDLGIDADVLAATLTCVVSQRLVRRICPECRETYYASPEELEELGQPVDDRRRLLARGRGCATCDESGFQGQTAIFELLVVNEEIRQLMRDRAPATAIRDAAVAGGMTTLRDELIRLCLEGLTTTVEMDRSLS